MKKITTLFLLLSLIGTACQAGRTAASGSGFDTPAPAGELKWSGFRGSFAAFISKAIASQSVAVVDKDIRINQPIEVQGNLVLKGTGITITHALEKLFVLGDGEHIFENFNVVQTADNSTAFFTVAETGKLWTNTFRNISITGGEGGYSSSRGGQYNAQRDEVVKWAGSIFENCVIQVKGGCAIAVFSQDGPCKFLHLKNVQLSTEVTHNIYVHPNVSLRFDSVVSLSSGKLAMHQFSGGNEQFYNTARYLEMSRVKSLKYSMWEMTNPKSGSIIINDCDIAPYTTLGVDNPRVMATNSRFYNGGNGAMLTGKLINCQGEVWSGKPGTLDIEGGSFDEINLRVGGTIKVSDANIKYLSLADRGNGFDGSFTNCTIMNLADGGNGNGKLKLRNSKPRMSNARAGVLVEQ